jgi:hypothetical protein
MTTTKIPFCICGKSGFVLFRFDPYFIVTGTCSRFSEVLVYSVQLSGKSIEMIRINQRLLSSCRLLHVARDSGVGRHLPCVHQLLSNVETKMKIYAKIVCTCLKLMILGMIYLTIYWRKVSLKSIKQTQYQSVTISDQLMGTTVFTPDMEEPIRVVKQFDSTLKYALFTIVWDIDVGMNNIDKAACSTVKSTFDITFNEKQNCN